MKIKRRVETVIEVEVNFPHYRNDGCHWAVIYGEETTDCLVVTDSVSTPSISIGYSEHYIDEDSTDNTAEEFMAVYNKVNSILVSRIPSAAAGEISEGLERKC